MTGASCWSSERNGGRSSEPRRSLPAVRRGGSNFPGQCTGITEDTMAVGNRVVVTDIEMEFLSMVLFMIKWVFASIPAVIFLSMIFGVIAFVFAMVFGIGLGALGLAAGG